MLAAAPAWFAENLTEIAAGTLLVLVVLVVRLVQKMMLRVVLLGLIGLVGLLVYANRDPLQACAETCECELAGRRVSVPICGYELDR